LVHYHCLISYIRSKLEDKAALLSSLKKEAQNGILCPYTLAGECGAAADHGERYYMTAQDLNSLVSFGIENGKVEHLTLEEVDKFRRWMNEPQETLSSINSGVDATDMEAAHHQKRESESEDLAEKFINATTKKCPHCGNRLTHYHGHACHHISPQGGCPHCKHHFCYSCESSEDMNLLERGAAHLCKCGGWSNFCKPFQSASDIALYLVTEPYPYDKRCGCPICSEVGT
jgi:hypothetical protein